MKSDNSKSKRTYSDKKGEEKLKIPQEGEKEYDNRYHHQMQISLAYFNLQKGDKSKAKESINKAIEISRELSSRDYQYTVKEAIRMYEMREDFKQACYYQDLLLDYYKQVNQIEVQKRKVKMELALKEARIEYKLQKVIQERVQAQLELEETAYHNERKEQINKISHEIYLRNARDAPKFIEFIKKCILEEDIAKAQKALVLYSRITRETYEILAKDEVELKKEWALITYYVELMNLIHDMSIEVKGNPPEGIRIVPFAVFIFIQEVNLNQQLLSDFGGIFKLQIEVNNNLICQIEINKCSESLYDTLVSLFNRISVLVINWTITTIKLNYING